MKLFDPHCYDLACIFLDDVKGATEANRNDLAITIQTAIEDWLEDRDSEAEAAHDAHIDAQIDEHGSYTTRKMQEFEADSKRACDALLGRRA